MAVEIGSPVRIIEDEITQWAGKIPDRDELLTQAKVRVGLFGDGFVLEEIRNRSEGRANLSDEELANEAIRLQAIMAMWGKLSPRRTSMSDVADEFKDLLVRNGALVNNVNARDSLNRVADALGRLTQTERFGTRR